MPSDSNTSFEFRIQSDAKEAAKQIDKITESAEDLKKEVEDLADAFKDFEDRISALGKKSDILYGQASGDKLSKAERQEKARLNSVLQYYATIEKYEKLFKKSERDKILEASGIAKAIPSASKEDVLKNRGVFLQGKMADALESWDYEKANSVRSQILANEEKIARLKEKSNGETRKGNAESEKTLEIVEKIKSAFSGIGGVIKSIGGKALAKITEPFKRMQKSISRVFASIGRIAFYRAIRSGIKAVTQGFSEGVKHLYAWSEAFNTKFAPTMDTFKTQMTYLHNGFAAMFSPLIEWVVPNVLVPLTDAMVEFFNFVQQGFATLVGHDYWYKAQKSITKFGEATKKANIQLAKFDELNNLTETGSGSEEDASGMFTLEKVSADFGKGFFKELRDEIKNGDWYGVGETIATSLNNGIGSLDARGIASNIAQKINNAIHLVQGFAENFDYEQLGRKIGGFIDQAIGDIEWKNLGSTGGNLVGGLLVTILSAIEEIDITQAVNAFFDFWDGFFGAISDRLSEDNGYHVKMMALKLTEFAISVVYNAFSRFRKSLRKLNLFSTSEGALFGKTLGLTKEQLDVMHDTNEYLAYQAILEPIRDAEDELTKSHQEWLDKQNKANEQAADRTRKEIYTTGQYVVSTMGQSASSAIKSYTSANWGTQIPYLNIKSAISGANIPYSLKVAGQNAVNAYVSSVDWANGGRVSAEGIKQALINAGIPISLATQASASIASMVNTYYGGQAQVTNALNQMTSGFDGTNTGRNIGQQIVNGMNSVIVSSPIASVGGRGGNYRVTLTPYARGGYLFASGGFASGLSQGTMYVAGEVPGQAEMVGQINGRTGVASGFEITGIRDAVISTGENEAQLLQRLITTLERKNLVISPSAQLGRVMAQSNRLYSGVTG